MSSFFPYYDFERHKSEAKGKFFARKYLRGAGRFLDVGCATGFFLNGIRANSEWETLGVEFGAAAVEFARKELDLNVAQGNLADAKFPDGHFDFVHVNNVLEHALEPLEMLEEARRILKPDGVFYLSVPNGFIDSRDLITFYLRVKIPARSKNGHVFFFPLLRL